jgi:hypothetical protein
MVGNVNFIEHGIPKILKHPLSLRSNSVAMCAIRLVCARAISCRSRASRNFATITGSKLISRDDLGRAMKDPQ